MSLRICQTCEHKRQRNCLGGCRYLLDQRPVLEHVMAQRCPARALRHHRGARIGFRFGVDHSAGPATAPAAVVQPSTASSSQPSPGGFFTHLAHGAAGLTKAALGMDRTEDFRLAYRRQTCAGCEHARRKMGLVDTCALCGCVIHAKTAVASERCPAGRW